MAKANLTAARLHEILYYDPSTGIFRWKAKASRFATGVEIGEIAGAERQDGYWYIYIDKVGYRAHRLAWMYIHGSTPSIIDHKNGVRSDNRIDNLRLATRALNNQNRSGSRARKLPTGVTSQGCRFTARIVVTLAGRRFQLYLGTFVSEHEANEIYLAAKKLMHPGAIDYRPSTI